MSGEPETFVKVVPYPKFRNQKCIQDNVQNTVRCKICTKAFLNAMALSNHARMEHINAYATGDPKTWTLDPHALHKTDKSNGKNYIIIKSQDGTEFKKNIMLDCNKEEVKETIKNKKEKQLLLGPIECLQLSKVSGDRVCHQIFFSCCEYSIHYRDEHTHKRKGILCQVCEKPLARKGENMAPCFCNVCGKGFQLSKELSEHSATAHVKLKPYKCKICMKRFTQKIGLYNHMRLHIGDKPFSCTFCSKAFTLKSGLDLHLRIHTNVKPYKCLICSKSFCQSTHLRQHMRTHTNVAPFSCGICEKRFKQGSHLNWHLKKHNPENMTEKQKAKYAELTGMNTGDVLEIEIDPKKIEIERKGSKAVRRQELWNLTTSS